MKKINKRLLATAVAAALALPTAAHATNGYFANGYSTKNKGLAGAGVALPQDSMDAATNPANMVWVGERMDLGATLFSPSDRGYTADDPVFTAPLAGDEFILEPGTFESDNDYFVIPHFGYNWMLDADSSLGVTVYGNGGMNTEYPVSMYSNPFGAPSGPGTYYNGTAGVDLSQLFVSGTYSRKINDKSSWGASLIVAYQRFKADGVGSFAQQSTNPSKLTNNGYDDSMGFGAKLGWQGEVAQDLTLGVSYQTKMDMDAFSDYAGLFAEQGGFDIPATWTIGLAYDNVGPGTLAFDVQQIMYSDVASIANPIANIFPPAAGGQCTANPPTGPGTGAGCLGGSNGAGFGWEDITVYKLGYQWSTSPDWTWRVGYSIGDQPIPDSEVLFNIIAPGVMEQHFTGGFTWKTGANSEFDFAAMYAPEVKVSGSNPFAGGSTGTATQQVELYMSQWEVSANWGWKF